MARPSKVDTCMFCGNAPCTCNQAKTSSPAKPRRPRAAAKPAAPDKGDAPDKSDIAQDLEKPATTSIHDAMRAAAKIKVEPVQVIEIYTIEEMDEEMKNAVRLFGDMMSPLQKAQWAPLFISDRAAAWKARRNVVVE